MFIRPLAEQDAPALLTFYNTLSPESIRLFRPLGLSTTLAVCQQIIAENRLALPTRYDLAAWDGSEMIGWVFIAELTTAHPYLGLAVADRMHGQGLGNRLLDQIMQWARLQRLPAVNLTVVQDNLRAIHLYQKYGFVMNGAEIGATDQLPYYRMVAQLTD